MNDLASQENYRPWQLLHREEYVEALALFRKNQTFESRLGRRRGLAEALLWTGKYVAAVDHLKEAIKRDEQFQAGSEEDFALLGAAEWCLGNYTSAVKAWQAGLKAPGSIRGCRTHCPLLLLLATILRPGIIARGKVETVLLQRVNSPRTRQWPGALAWYALGLIDESALEATWYSFPPRNVRLVGPDAEWIKEFYEAALALEDGKVTIADFRSRLRLLEKNSKAELLELNNFIYFTYNAECYIGRHEAERGVA